MLMVIWSAIRRFARWVKYCAPTYAVGIWRLRRWALPFAWAYAAYVVANSVFFRLRYPMPSALGQRIFEVTYAVVAIATAVGTALLLTRGRDQLT